MIHPTAVIDPKATLGEGVGVGPYCVIGPGVKIGDRTRLLSHVVLDRNLGGHEAWAGDVDGDGDIDVVSKTWRSGVYRESANGGAAHADFLENLLINR